MGDSLAGPRDVVSALLQDPIADSAETKAMIDRRYEGADEAGLRIRFVPPLRTRLPDFTHHCSFGTSPRRTAKSLLIPSSFLQASGCDIVEVNGAF